MLLILRFFGRSALSELGPALSEQVGVSPANSASSMNSLLRIFVTNACDTNVALGPTTTGCFLGTVMGAVGSNPTAGSGPLPTAVGVSPAPIKGTPEITLGNGINPPELAPAPVMLLLIPVSVPGCAPLGADVGSCGLPGVVVGGCGPPGAVVGGAAGGWVAVGV